MRNSPYLDKPALTERERRLADALKSAEAALGENLTWLADQLDLKIRQKDSETLRKLAQLDAAWLRICSTLAELDR